MVSKKLYQNTLTLRAHEAGRLVCPNDPQSCIGGSLVLLAGLALPGRFVGERADKTPLGTGLTTLHGSCKKFELHCKQKPKNISQTQRKCH